MAKQYEIVNINDDPSKSYNFYIFLLLACVIAIAIYCINYYFNTPINTQIILIVFLIVVAIGYANY